MATLVRFIGGPFAGQAEASTAIDADPLRATGAVMAEMAYHDYAAHPPAAGAPKWVLCRVHSGKAAGPHFYKIVSGQMNGSKLELTCEYGGTQYPAG
ncbi:MAG TPA: hypothetical protein VGI40_12280 [Pirellulaceae bacterium]|jgi:hypothetical protein